MPDIDLVWVSNFWVEPHQGGAGLGVADGKAPADQHLAIQVADLDATLARLKERNIELTNPEPRQKADGTRYIFIHPRSAFGVLPPVIAEPDTSQAEM